MTRARVLAAPSCSASAVTGMVHRDRKAAHGTSARETVWYYWGMQEETARSAIDTFISAFNASDDSYVTVLLSRALTSDVVFWGPLGRSEGIEAVERFVLDIRRHPAGTGTMVRCSAVDMPNEWARYQWVFTTPDGGPRLAGTDVVHLRRSLIDQVIVFAGEIEPSAS
ncbi:hypothetical protein GA0115254_124321 [Streptomyces sp. Ncost-T10-10d]|nr:hypothetical protein GA0115254_124321 [Streptomyces sp. Ncost-T10-10d]